MKQLFLIAALFATVHLHAATAGPSANPAVTFSRFFKQAENVKWHHGAQYSQAAFTVNGIATKALFSKKGTLLKTTRYYTAARLPLVIENALQAAIAYRHIWGVTEVSRPGAEAVYHVVLQNDGEWIYATVTADGSLAAIE